MKKSFSPIGAGYNSRVRGNPAMIKISTLPAHFLNRAPRVLGAILILAACAWPDGAIASCATNSYTGNMDPPDGKITKCVPVGMCGEVICLTNGCYDWAFTNWNVSGKTIDGNFVFGDGGWGWLGTYSDPHIWGIPSGDSCLLSTDGQAVDQDVTLTGTGYIETYNPGHSETAFSASFTFHICESDKCGSCSSSSCNGAPSGPSPHAPSLGTARVGNDLGPSIGFNLGAYSSDQDAGFLALNARATTGSLTDPALLYVPFSVTGSNGVIQVLTNSGTGKIGQVRSPQGLLNVAVVNAYSYQLQEFYNSSIGVLTNGLYTTNASAFATWTVTNPNGSANNNVLVVSLNESGVPDPHYTYTYTNVSGVNQWQLTDGAGLRTVASWQVQDPTYGSGYTDVVWQVSSGGKVVQSVTKIYQLSVVQNATQNLLIQEIDGTGGATYTTSYFYTTNAFAILLQQVNYPEGNWEYYLYDSENRVITKWSAYMNSPPPTGGAQPTVYQSGCQEVDYTYDTPEVAGDVTTNQSTLARLEVRSLPWPRGDGYYDTVEVSRIYRSVPNTDEVDEYRCPIAGESYTNAGVLVTRTVTLGNTNDMNTFGKTWWQVMPDGTASIYSYTEDNNGVLTNVTVQTGQPDSTINPTTIINGTQKITALNSLGQPTRVTTQAIVNSTLSYILSQDSYVYSGSLQDSYTVGDLANRTNQYNYACCGLDNTVDPDGVLTTYTYDILRRAVANTVVRGGSTGVTTTNVMDGANRVLVTQRIGTDGSVIALNETMYDPLGRIGWQTNALGGVTAYSNVVVNSQLCITNVNPDGGTRLEIHYSDGKVQTVTNSAAAPVIYQYGSEYDSASGQYTEFSLMIKSDGNGGTNEWVKTDIDGVGRSYRTTYSSASSNPIALSFYNSQGQLTNQIDPDGVLTLYAYNPKGELAYTVLDLNKNTNIDFTGSDRITFTTNDFVSDHGTSVSRNQVYAWSTNSVGTSNLISTVETSTNGLWTWNTLWNNGVGLVSQTALVYASGGNRYLTNIAPDNSYTVSAYQYGLLSSVTKYDANHNQIGQTAYGYDAHYRQNTSTDARNGTTTYTFNNADQISSMVTPPPAQTASYYFDTMGRSIATTLPDGTSLTNVYYPTSLLELTYGSQTYPAGYSYDAQGRMKTMTNWSNFSSLSGSRVTTWNYDAYRGFLSSKTYAGSTAGPAYAYTGAGRLLTRLWARGTNTTYSYNAAGDLSGASYNDGATPSLSYGFDRRGRQNAITNGTAVCTLTLNDAGNVLSEAYTGTGPLNGFSITNGYDSILRRTNNVALNGSTVLARITNNWDAASRLLTVSDGTTNSATYSYLANSPLVGQIGFTNSGSLRMTTVKTYDNLNRLVSISSANAQSVVLDSHAYSYNTSNQRERNTFADGSAWQYIYDSLGQVISGHRFFSDETPVAGQQFDYTFDTIGNRTQTLAGGDQTGGNQRQASYTANNLNQYTQRTVPGDADIMGVSFATNSVTVGGQTAYRKGEYFREQLPVSNGSAAVWTNITTSATGQASVTGNVYIPETPENYGYDADGNLNSDGRWDYSWDGENRLISMQGLSGIPTGAKLQLNFVYDFLGRRIQKMVSTNNGSAYYPQSTNRFVYDGWNVLAIINPSSSVLQAFVWGLDLSGSQQGAGGVGGLIEVRDLTNGVHFAAYDGNGNVADLVNATNGAASASYEYGPFGELLRATGPMAKLNPFRFSTKYCDDETDLLYYGYRYYNPSTGRWLSRDPLSEQAFLWAYLNGKSKQAQRSLQHQALLPPYLFVSNDPISDWDVLGLIDCTKAPPLLDTCPDCNKYGNGMYMGSSLKCFCKCAGNSKWAQQVRACLACEFQQGTDISTAHHKCYAAAGGVMNGPVGTLAYCWLECFGPPDAPAPTYPNPL